MTQDIRPFEVQNYNPSIHELSEVEQYQPSSFKRVMAIGMVVLTGFAMYNRNSPIDNSIPNQSTEDVALMTPEAKYTAETNAIQNALQVASQTGDLGALNHYVAYSPIFHPRYDLPSGLEFGQIRAMPPANLLNLPGLNYEFSTETPDKERLATAPMISIALASAYKFNQVISSNQKFADLYKESCVRFGDFSSLEGHVSHWGSQFDITSSLKCDIINGHKVADGPVFKINSIEGGINKNIQNENYNSELDDEMLKFMLSLHINDQPLVKNILYNTPNPPDERVKELDNHNNHGHVQGSDVFKNTDLKDFADGGERPEQDLEKLKSQIFSDYEAGVGIEGVSKATNKHEFNSPEINALMDEIAKGEGGFDSINTGTAGDTTVGSDKYYELLGDRNLSQLTIQEVLDLQAEGKIFATGRWQIVEGTLNGAVVNTGIDTSRPYDESAQRELATYLILGGIKRPKVTNFLMGGDTTVEEALEDLCAEWAGVPCNDGFGRYDEDKAGNMAHGGLERVQRIKQLLISAREAFLKSKEKQQVKMPKVALIGDSLSVGYDKFGEIMTLDESFGIEISHIDAKESRPLVGGDFSGMLAIEQNQAAIAESNMVVIGLGTNAVETDEQYKQGVVQAIERINQINPNTKLAFIQNYSYKNGTKSAERRDRRNQILDDVLDDYKNAYVVSIDSSNLTFAEDKVHLTKEGYQEAAKQILIQLKLITS